MRLIGQAELGDLRGLMLFRGIDESDLVELLEHAYLYRLEAKETLPMQQQVSPRSPRRAYVYAIKDGYFTVYLTTKYEDIETSFVAWRGKGQILGEGGMIRADLDEKNGFHVDCYPPADTPKFVATDPSTLIGFPIGVFKETAAQVPMIYRNLSLILSDKIFLERVRTQIIQTPGRNATPKIARTLAYLVQVRGFRKHCEPMAMPNGQQASQMLDGSVKTTDIAGYLGVKNGAVLDALEAIREEKVIYYSTEGLRRGEIYVVNISTLEAY